VLAGDIPEKKQLPWWRWLVEQILYPLDGDPGSERVLTHRNLVKHSELEKAAANAKNVGEARVLLVQVLVAQLADNAIFGYGDTEKALGTALALAGLGTWKDQLAKAKERIEKPPVADGKETCGSVPKDGKASGCIFKPGHDGLHGNGYRRWSNKDAKPTAKSKSKKKKGGAK